MSLPILRKYQTDARYQINTLLNAGRSPCLVISTGCGKTKTACTVISDRIALGEIVYVVVPSLESFTQWVSELQTAGLNPGWINDEGMKGRGRKVYVCMPQSLSNIINMIPEASYPNKIIFDEAHHTACNTWDGIIRFFKNPGSLGLTATPRRIDNKPLTMFTDIVSTITMQEAIDAEYLAKPLIIVPDELYRRIDVPTDDIDTRSGLEKQAAALGETAIIGDVICQYARVFGGLPVLVACSTYQHAAMMAEQFTAAGWKFEHIHSLLPASERRRMLRQIRSGELHGLCTVGIGIEAVDIPGLYGLIWLRRTMSVTIYLQFIGRVLRPLPGKQYGIILDPVGNLFIHGFPEAPRTWTLEGEGSEERTPDPDTPTMRICPRCGVANATANQQCHMCGLDFNSEEAHSIRERHLPAMIDGKLVAITSDGMEAELSSVSEAALEEAIASEETGKPLSKLERIDFLQKGLFAGARSELMREALEEWRR